MIIVHLKGGLGNQLFQYAAGLSLATYQGVEVKVNITELGKPDDEIGTLRNFDLQHLISPPLVASSKEIERYTNRTVIQNFAEKLKAPYKRKIYKEASFAFDPNFFFASNDLYLKGYRQSEKYFKRFEKIIREQYILKADLTKHLQSYTAVLAQTNSVALHIRRGDFTNNQVEDYHGTLSQSFYMQAIDRIKSIVPTPVVYVFSDNIEWAKQHLQLNIPVEFVSGSVTKSHLEDFYLMKRCKHNILANSSFSWWAAWLNQNPNKIVIAPKKWFNKAQLDTNDLIPETWIQI